MSKGLHEGNSQRAQVFHEGSASGQTAPQRQEIDTVANQFVTALVRTLCGRYSDYNLLLPRKSVQEDIVGGQKCLEQRAFLTRAQATQVSAQRGLERAVFPASAKAGVAGAGEVQRQLECRWQCLELLQPIVLGCDVLGAR